MGGVALTLPMWEMLKVSRKMPMVHFVWVALTLPMWEMLKDSWAKSDWFIVQVALTLPMWEMLKVPFDLLLNIPYSGSCFDSPDVGDVELIGKVERSSGLKIYRIQAKYFF